MNRYMYIPIFSLIISCNQNRNNPIDVSGRNPDKEREKSVETFNEMRKEVYGNSCDTTGLYKNISTPKSTEKGKRISICIYWTYHLLTLNKVGADSKRMGKEAVDAISDNNKELAIRLFKNIIDTIKNIKIIILSESVPAENVRLNVLGLTYYCSVIEAFNETIKVLENMNNVKEEDFLNIVNKVTAKDRILVRAYTKEMERLRDLYKLDEIDLENEMKRN